MAIFAAGTALLSADGAAAIPIRVLFVGDSITAGGASVPVGPGFVDLLTDQLGVDYELINVGCAGSGAFGWQPAAGELGCAGRPGMKYDLFDEFVLDSAPFDLAVVLLGSNDSALGFHPLGFAGWYGEILDGIFGAGADRIIAMTPPARPAEQDAAQALIEAYADAITDPVSGACAVRSFVSCGPDLLHLLDRDLDFAAGDVHPNAYGHAKIADALYHSIVPEPATGVLVALGLLVLGLRREGRSRTPPDRLHRVTGSKNGPDPTQLADPCSAFASDSRIVPSRKRGLVSR